MSRAAKILTALLVTVTMPSLADDSALVQDAAQKAKVFLGSLDSVQRTRATFPFDGEERVNWHFIPKTRKGLPLKEMTEAQQDHSLALLRTALSAKGFKKAQTVRSLEGVLRDIEQGRGFDRDPERYYVSIFGEPSPDATWGLRFEGHHLSLNWTFVEGESVSGAPQFFGANPAEVPSGPMKGTRLLATEEDLARTLVRSLTAGQQASAIISDKAPRDILTGADRQAAALEDRGVAYADLDEGQQGTLMALIEEVASAQAAELTADRLRKIKDAGLDGVKFAWMGSVEQGEGHYYRVQGPTFLIEYDNTQNRANHIHLVWRDFKGDFGRDLLREHYQAYAHPSVSGLHD